jgi:hypothetical protein
MKHLRTSFAALQRHPFVIAVAALLVLVAVFGVHGFLAAPIFGAVLNEGKYAAEFLLSELPGKISRDTVTVTVPANTTLDPGWVLGKISASGKYTEYDPGFSDGRETASAVLYAALVNDTGGAVDMDGVVVNFGAEVRTGDLGWKSGVDANEQAAGIVDLTAVGIKART